MGGGGASRACATSTRNLASACRTGAETQPRATHEVRSARLALDFVARPALLTERFFQNRDLARVVEIVLNLTMQVRVHRRPAFEFF
jgi:hypothetical protein